MFLYVFSYKKYFLQQVENRAIISVFARWCLKNTANTVVDFATSGKDIVNTVALGFRSAKNIGISGVMCSESLKKKWKHNLFDDF